MEELVDPVVAGAVLRVEGHEGEGEVVELLAEHGAHDGGRHHAAGRGHEGDVGEAVAGPAAEEGIGGEQVHGVDFPDQQRGFGGETMAVVDRGRDQFLRMAERQDHAGVGRPDAAGAGAGAVGGVAEAGFEVGVEAAAVPEAELAGVHREEGVGAAAPLEVLVTGARQQSGVVGGGGEIETDAAGGERIREAEPAAGQGVAGRQILRGREGQRRGEGCGEDSGEGGKEDRPGAGVWHGGGSGL